eukprot:TRINITY_DN1301_c1_g1_i1.p2 TRINITY_DN1301_c1_g1~~TRINITY_DN1301_c1_g1_i1.p2  ORF type:complete len:269 (+),score=51.88 TRINITY_DN1301_c1_g1_i1:67-873(+)
MCAYIVVKFKQVPKTHETLCLQDIITHNKILFMQFKSISIRAKYDKESGWFNKEDWEKINEIVSQKFQKRISSTRKSKRINQRVRFSDEVFEIPVQPASGQSSDDQEEEDDENEKDDDVQFFQKTGRSTQNNDVIQNLSKETENVRVTNVADSTPNDLLAEEGKEDSSEENEDDIPDINDMYDDQEMMDYLDTNNDTDSDSQPPTPPSPNEGRATRRGSQDDGRTNEEGEFLEVDDNQDLDDVFRYSDEFDEDDDDEDNGYDVYRRFS